MAWSFKKRQNFFLDQRAQSEIAPTNKNLKLWSQSWRMKHPKARGALPVDFLKGTESPCEYFEVCFVTE